MTLAIVLMKRCMWMRRIDAIGEIDPHLYGNNGVERRMLDIENAMPEIEIEHCKQGNTLECVTPSRIKSQMTAR